MDNVQELDGCDEAEGQRLLTVAFETAPVGEAPAGELLRQVRRRDKTRRVRTLVPAGAVAAVGGAAAVAVTLTATVAAAPSAFAAVTAAAAKTSAESFHVTVRQTVVGRSAGGLSSGQVAGDFDPSRGVGDETASSGAGQRGPLPGQRVLRAGFQVGPARAWQAMGGEREPRPGVRPGHVPRPTREGRHGDRLEGPARGPAGPARSTHSPYGRGRPAPWRCPAPWTWTSRDWYANWRRPRRSSRYPGNHG